MRSTYTFLLVALPALALLNIWWFGRELRAFVDSTPVISSTVDIERMKAVVSRQMYAALAQIVLLAAAPAVFLFGLYRGALQAADVLYVIVPSAAVIVLSIGFKRVEAEARSLEAADDELRGQRDRIVQTWMRRPFPDW
jgi:fatty acid desaturase